MPCGAARALGILGSEEALEDLLRALDDPAWVVRAVAARALGALGRGEAAPALARKAGDPAFWVRVNATKALASLGEEGRRELRSLLLSPDRYARDAARAALSFPGGEGGG